MEVRIPPMVADLLPLVRGFCRGEYGIALGGAHAKGVEDAVSDLDLYLFARDVLSDAERERLCRAFGPGVEAVTGWSYPGAFTQVGTDFRFRGLKVEVWLRHTDLVGQAVADAQAGIVRQDLVTWTVMGFFNHCALSDLHWMVPADDPHGILARLKSAVEAYPPRLGEAIVTRHLEAARFWPGNFHYETAVERVDAIYVMGIVQQVVFNLIQVVFAINREYFPGEKKLAAALGHLAVRPDRFPERVQALVHPGVLPTRASLREQARELGALLREVEQLVRSNAG